MAAVHSHPAARPPGPAGTEVLRSLFARGSQDTLAAHVAQWQRYGDVVRIPLVFTDVVLFVHPEHIRELVTRHKDNLYKGFAYDAVRHMLGLGLVTSEGALWQRQRRLMQPRFSAAAVAGFAHTMLDCVRDVLARWQRRARDGRPVQVEREMMNLTMRIIGKTMLGVDLATAGGDPTKLGRALEQSLAFMTSRGNSPVPVPLWVPLPQHRRFKAALRELDAFVYGLIGARRRQLEAGQAPEDLVTLLLQARDEDGEPIAEHQIRDEVLTIFFAGHETTAGLLTWTWVLLAQHPDVEARLHQELAPLDRVPTVADLARLPYARMILDETLRLYPAAPVFPRNARQAATVGGYHVPKGAMVLFSPFITHRHPEFWPDPERFDPQRFTPERSRDRPPYAYYPFGIGHRTCIGNHFALLEAHLALATMAQRVRLRPIDDRPVRPRMLGTLRTDRPVLMTVEPR